MSENDWVTHNSTEPPELAPAALVELEVSTPFDRNTTYNVATAIDKFNSWFAVVKYRPLTDDEGHKLISAEGLEDWAHYVTTDKDGVWQWDKLPEEKEWLAWDEVVPGSDDEAPESHRHPGDWRDSLYRVEGR